MRKILILFWCLVPLSMAAYHYGPGQERLTIDDAGAELRKAEKYITKAEKMVEEGNQEGANDEYQKAIELFDKAIQNLPSEREGQIQEIRLEKAKALFSSQQNPKARLELESLMEDLNAEEEADQNTELIAETRDALAASQYYLAWLMRIEGLPREVWEPEVDRSRHNYRTLAEDAEKAGSSEDAKRAKENLEASVRLAMVELDDLQGLPLPSQ